MSTESRNCRSTWRGGGREGGKSGRGDAGVHAAAARESDRSALSMWRCTVWGLHVGADAEHGICCLEALMVELLEHRLVHSAGCAAFVQPTCSCAHVYRSRARIPLNHSPQEQLEQLLLLGAR